MTKLIKALEYAYFNNTVSTLEGFSIKLLDSYLNKDYLENKHKHKNTWHYWITQKGINILEQKGILPKLKR